MDNYDTLITKAALHGAKLLKKSHQATAVGLASHLWWQEAQPVIDADGEAEAGEKKKEASEKAPVKEEGSEASVKAVCILLMLSTNPAYAYGLLVPVPRF